MFIFALTQTPFYFLLGLIRLTERVVGECFNDRVFAKKLIVTAIVFN